MSQTVDVSQLTDEQLEQAMAARKKAKASQQAKAKKEYETQRDLFVSKMVTRALEINEIVRQFKAECHVGMEDQAIKLEEYGKLRSNSKGGFSLTDEAGVLRIVRTRNTEPRWDERSLKGVELIEQFLKDTVKKKDVNIYEILIKFMKRNENGHLEYAKVMMLLQEEHRYTDEKWLEGLRLIKEGYSNHLKAYGYDIKTRTTTEGWESVLLNFSSL